MLEIRGLYAGYGSVRILHDINISVEPGEAVGVLGRNGAGKTTLLRAIAGNCNVTGGELRFAGDSLNKMRDHERAGCGIGHVLEGRRVWPSMTVRENLMLGAWRLPPAQRRTEVDDLLAYTLDMFPRLRERLHKRAGVLSGGEQQMVAIGRALMSKPTLMLIDEPSIGLAPIMVDVVMDALRRLRENKSLAIMLVEQRIQEVLDLCSRVYILNRGRMEVCGRPSSEVNIEHVKLAYIGGTQ